MTDPMIMLDDEGEVVRMVNQEGDPKISKIMKARDLRGNLEEKSNSDFDHYADLSDEELAQEFQKLSPADKIQYNEWFDFHSKYQQNTGIGGTISQIICSISNQNKPLIPDEILKKEFEEVDVDPDQVQIECMIDKDGKEVKRVKPILIKKEITTDYATQVPFELGPGEDVFLFTDEERVPYADHSYEPKIEEETDDDDYMDDDILIKVDSDSC